MLISKIHEYIHTTKHIHSKKGQYDMKRKLNTIPYIHKHNIIYHLRSNNYRHFHSHLDKIRTDDIVIGTDSGHEYGITGIGIIIKNNENIIRSYQPLGGTTNNFGECFAIRKALYLIERYNIDTNYRRIIIMTDSLCNFLPLLIKPPDRKNHHTNNS